MSLPSQSLTFQSLFDVALQDYEKKTGTKLADHPLAKQLEACDSVDSVTSFLQERARAFQEFRGEDGKCMRSLKRVVHVLYTLSTNAAVGESIGLIVRREIFLGIPRLLHILNSHSHQRKQYSPDSLSYSPYIPSLVLMRIFLCLINISLAGRQRHHSKLRYTRGHTRIDGRLP